MTYVYKRLLTGGYTAKPAESPVVRQRLISQGWSETVPLSPKLSGPVFDALPPEEQQATRELAAELTALDTKPDVVAQRKRGRRARVESVN